MNDTAATKALYSASVARIQSLMPRSFEAMEMDKGNEAASSTLSIAGAYDNPDDAIWLDTAKITFRFSGADANPGYATWGSLEVYDGFKASGQSSLTSLLDCAANAGDEKAKATFFDLGSTDLNVRSEYGLTPLHRAADWGNVEAINILLDKGAKTDVNVPKPSRLNPDA